MGSLTPFQNCLENNAGVNHAREHNTDCEEDEQRFHAALSGATACDCAPKEKRQQEIPHRYARHPFFMRNKPAALPAAPVAAEVNPAAPPKMAWVMLGIKSMLMMKTTKTIRHGMRFAIHISIE
jgi:hypothetical protein